MAIIYSYPTVIPTGSDLVLGTDVDKNGNPTKNFTVQSIIDLVSVTAQNLNQVLTTGNDAIGLSIVNLGNLGSGSITNTGSIGTSTLTATGVIQAETFQTTAGAATWSTTVLAGFTSISTETVTVSSAFAGAALLQVITTPVAPATGSTTKIASEKAIIDYIATNPVTETLAETLLEGNVTGGSDISITNGDSIVFGTGSTSAIKLGDQTTAGGNNGGGRIGILGSLFIINNPNEASANSGTIIQGNNINLRTSNTNQANAKNYLTATKWVDAASTGVLLYYNNTKKFETTDVGIDVTGIMTTDNIVNPGYYNGSNGVGTAGQLLSSTVTGTSWIANPNPTPYIWKIEGDSGAITTVVNADTIHFKGMNDGGTPLVGITTAFVPGSKELRITANGLADGDGQAGEVAFWSGTGLTSTLAGDTGMTYDAATDNLTVVGIIQGGTLSDGTASINSGVGAAFKSITTTISTTTNNANGFFGPLRTNAASTNYAAGVADQAVQLTGTGTINLNAGGSEVASTTGTYKAGAVIALDVTLNNDAVIGKVLTGLSVPATGNSIEPDDSIVIAFGKLQAQHNTSVNGLRYIGTWDARTQAEGGSAGDEGNPALADGGGVITTGTNTSVVADQLVDSGKDFTALGVAIGERVYNQAGTFTTVSAVGTTTLTLNEDIFLTNGQTYSVDNNPALSQGEYYVVNQAGTVDLNGIASWAIGDWVIAGAGNTWEKLDQTGVDGTGSINRIPRWDTVSSLNDSIILQSATGITLDTGKNFATQGAGTITSAAMLTAAADFTLTGGINLPTGYGGSGQVLTTNPYGGGTGTDMVWTTPTTGTLTGVTAGTGITVDPSAAPSPTVNIDYVGADNAILSATQYLGTDDLLDTDVIWFNQAINAVANNTVSYAQIGSLPFDNYQHWILSDGTSTATITSTNTAEILGGTGITSTVVAADKSATLSIDYLGTDNVILEATSLTAGAAIPSSAEIMFNDNTAGTNTVSYAPISSLPFTPAVSGTQYTIPMFATTSTLGDSMVTQNAGGTIATVSGELKTTTFKIANNQVLGGATVALGTGANASGGSYSVGIGAYAGGSQTATYNTAVGAFSLGGNNGDSPSGGGNTAIGASTLRAITSGSQNTAVGYRAGAAVTTGSNNIYLGDNAGYTSSTASKEIVIGDNTLGNGSNTITIGISGQTVFYGGVNGINIGSSSKRWGDIYGALINVSGDGTFGGNVQVDGDLTVDGNIIHGGTGNGGTYNFSDTVNASSNEDIFSIQCQHGAQTFTAYFTCNTSSFSVAKTFTVAHAHSATVVYNKLIDTGPFSGEDFTVSFTQATDTITCNIANGSTSLNADIVTTVVLGGSPTALTVTAL